MSKTLATVLAVLGGAWTGLCGVLLVGLLVSLGDGSITLSQINGGVPSATPFVWMACLLLAGIAMFWTGIRHIEQP